MHPLIRGTIGIAALLLVAWALSLHRRRFPIRTVVAGLLLQWVLALLVLRTDTGRECMSFAGALVAAVLNATRAGTRFLLGSFADTTDTPWGFVFAIQVIPPIIVFSALSAIGYHLGIMQRIVSAMAWVMKSLLRTSGAESLSAAGNVFLGQTEAPLLVRPYIPLLTTSELMAVMVGGFATSASGVIASYVTLIAGDDPIRQAEVTRHFLTASLMSAPASLALAKIIVPETEVPTTMGSVRIEIPRTSRNLIDAAAIGSADGAKLAFNVCAMLLAFIALLALLDAGLKWVGGFAFVQPALAVLDLRELSISQLLGVLFAPVAWLIGAAPEQCRSFGSLLGLSMAANEFVAYTQLREMMNAGQVSERTVLLATYSMCGFANFSSIAIQIGGIGAMAPSRRSDLARLGLRAMVGGALASWMTGTIAGMLS